MWEAECPECGHLVFDIVVGFQPDAVFDCEECGERMYLNLTPRAEDQ